MNFRYLACSSWRKGKGFLAIDAHKETHAVLSAIMHFSDLFSPTTAG